MALTAVALPVAGWFVSPIFAKVLEHGVLQFKEKRELEKGVQDEIDRLGSVLCLLKGFLEDAEQKQSENPGVLAWLGLLKEDLYDAEDLLDMYEVDLTLMHQRKTSRTAQVSSCLSALFSRRKSYVIGSVAEKMKKIRERLDDLLERGHKLGLQEKDTSIVAQGSDSSIRKRRETYSSLADDSTVIGRDDEKSAIIKILLSDDGEKKPLVLPVIGMGGLGKTTLAKLLFNDKDVESFFKLRVWVYVGISKELDIEKIIMEIVNSIIAGKTDHQDCKPLSLESLQRTLINEIKDQGPLLLVLDDAWDERSDIWDKILDPLKVVGIICKIIITTRDQKVADAIWRDRCKPIYLNFLKEEYMWSIFKRSAFGGDDAVVYPQLEAIGRNIVRKLKGLPLAAQTIGGIFHERRDAMYWRSILESKLLEIQQERNYMLHILMLSYNSLPVHLKRCFSYFSLFPKYYKFRHDIRELLILDGNLSIGDKIYAGTCFEIDDIFYQWVAHKFIQRQGEIGRKNIGSEIIISLLNRSLLQRDQCGNIMIHELVHELAYIVSKEEFLRCSDGTIKQIPKKLRHLSFFHVKSLYMENLHVDTNMLQELKKCKTLRTLIFHQHQKIDITSSILNSLFDSLRCLRVLSLRNTYIESLPDSIGNLKLLSSLDLYLPKIEKLPETISTLYNLQFLSLSDFERLPNSLTRLVNLIALSIDKNTEIFNNIGKLTNLQKLDAFHVKKQDGHKVMELKNLNGLCGSLRILHLENVESKEEAQQAHLDQKVGLECLTLSWSGTATSAQEHMQVGVLEGLRPNPNLKKLSIDGYLGTYSPDWLNCKHLPWLKILELEDCLKLKSIRFVTEILEGLEIEGCPELVELPLFPPTLQDLTLSNVGVISLMPSPSASQSLPSLRRLKVDGCAKLDESLNTLLKCSLPSLDYLYISDYSHPLEVLSHLTALSRMSLDKCFNKVIIDVQALTSMKYLNISECPNATIEGSQSNSSLCSSLRQLFMKKSPLLLKSLCQSRVSLPSLKKLEIKEDGLDECLLSVSVSSITALEELIISDCPNIRSISGQVLHKLVPLRTCKISSCGMLVELDLLALRSLKFLELKNCASLVFKRPQSSSNLLLKVLKLKGLRAEQVGGLFSILANNTSVERMKPSSSSVGLPLPLEYLSLDSLKALVIISCIDVTSLPILESLVTLVISGCPDLMFRQSPSVSFPSLERLKVYDCNKQQLTHLILLATRSPLRTLHVGRCEELIRFDGDLELPFLFLTSLQCLHINGCEHLQELPADLKGFRDLFLVEIHGCHRLSSLPVTEGLPTSLRAIRIRKCPMLEARYGQGEGNPHGRRIYSNHYVEFLPDDEDL